MPALDGIGVVLVVGVVAAVVGIGLGIVLAPRIGQALDRAADDDDSHATTDEEPG